MNTPNFVGHAGSSRRLRIHSGSGGFTLTELAVVIATVGILAMLVLPSLAASRANSRALQCLTNLKNLQLGSQLYASDNNDYLPGNIPSPANGSNLGFYQGSGLPPAGTYPSWVAGVMGWNSTPPESGSVDNPPSTSTNAAFLGVQGNVVNGPPGAKGTLIGSIGGYVKSVRAYKCPADKTIDSYYKLPRVRDCSANCFVGVNANWVAANPGLAYDWLPSNYQSYSKYSDFYASKLSAAQCFVFLDESPLSCNDGFFLYAADASYLNDLPGVNHGNSSSFSFADGHAEFHQWSDAVLAGTGIGTMDLQWLASHGTYLK